MPNIMRPQSSQVHINRPLTNVMLDWKNVLHELIEVFPIVPVKNESDSYFVFDQADAFRDEADIRRIGGEATEIGIKMGTPQTYTIQEYAAKAAVYDRIRNNSDSPLRLDVKAAQRAVNKVDLRRESVIATLLATQANWTGSSATVTNKWDAATSDPIGNIDTVIDDIQGKTLMIPNTMVMGRNVWRVLKRHSDIIELIKTTAAGAPAMVTKQKVAELFELDRVIVVNGIRVATVEGATDSYTRIFTDGTYNDNVWIGYVSKSPSIDEPSAGYTFQLQNGVQAVNWREDRFARSMVEARKFFDAKAVSSLCGAVLQDVLT